MVFCHFCGKNNSTIPQTGKVSVSARKGSEGGRNRVMREVRSRTTNQWQATIFTDTGVRASYEFLSCHIVWKSSQRNEFNARITWSYTHLLLNHHSLIPNKSVIRSQKCFNNKLHSCFGWYLSTIHFGCKRYRPPGGGGCLPDPAEISLRFGFSCGNKPYGRTLLWWLSTGDIG